MLIDLNLLKKLKRAFKSKIAGDFLVDELTRIQYSTAACIYRIFPLGVVFPKDGDDVIKTTEIAGEFGISLTARGAGAGVTGGALGTGLVIDFSKYMNRILTIDADHQEVYLEPGVVLDDLNRALRKHNLFFPPDPSSQKYCTLGGMIANNASGAHSLKYGATLDYVNKLALIMNDASEQTFSTQMKLDAVIGTRMHEIITGLQTIQSKFDRAITTCFPDVMKNSSGYLLKNIVNSDGSINAVKPLVASEGTLGLFVGAQLSVRKLPDATGTILMFCASRKDAGEAILRLGNHNPTMIEIMEDTFVDLVRQSTFDIGIAFPQTLRSILLVEFDGTCTDEVYEKINNVENDFSGPGSPVISTHRGVHPDEKERLNRLRHSASPILNRIPPPLYPVRFIEDGTVPVHRIPDYIDGLETIFGKHKINGVIFGHGGVGNLHVNPIMDVSDPMFPKKLNYIADEWTDLILHLNGSMSGEHGDGYLRSQFLPKIFSDSYNAIKDLKNLFDPDNMFNPGKIIAQKNYGLSDNLKLTEFLHPIQSDSALDDPNLQRELARCSGCGACRSYCPVFLASYDEIATPRAKSNLIKNLLSARRINFTGVGPHEKQILDLCIGCDTCLTECPSGVDIPYLVRVAKHAYYLDWGPSIPERITNSIHLLSTLAKLAPHMINRLTADKRFRNVLEKMIDLDRRRGLPRVSTKPLNLNSVISDQTKQIVYLPGCFTELFDRDGEAASIIHIFEHHDFKPFIPNLDCCGITEITNGFADSISRTIQHNASQITDLLHQSDCIVTGSPSCGLALRSHYRNHLPPDQFDLIKESVIDIHEFLIRLLAEGRLDMNFKPLPYRIAIHQPCHARALNIGDLTNRILSLIPGLHIHELSLKCCGMAGTFGLNKNNFDLSMKIAKPLLIELNSIQPDFVVSSCGMCRMQLEQGSGFPTLHPITLLACAYSNPLTPQGLCLNSGV